MSPFTQSDDDETTAGHRAIPSAGTGPRTDGVRCALCGHPIRHVGPQSVHWVHVVNGLPACALAEPGEDCLGPVDPA